MIRRITAKERRLAGNIYCPYCKPVKRDAVWRKRGFCDKTKDVACDWHSALLHEETTADYTEADYQTWLRL